MVYSITPIERSTNKVAKGFRKPGGFTGFCRQGLGQEGITERRRADEIRALKKESASIESAIKVLNKHEKEQEVQLLIDKWKAICQGAMAFLMNSTLLKIGKMGGYEELVKKEVEAEKRKFEYQFSDQLENEIDGILESDDFKMLSEYDQEDLRRQMELKREESKAFQQRELEKLDAKTTSCAEGELTMEELAKRLKVDYNLIFGE
ncbi:LADA_0C08240g1_1 [Lachancea dasiensis]|uniref:LADA_0C08240g1_1 n=1 Tax=Lachancea dasiensis TaxID=1072105 RepID=A0A1G4J0G4_9SACH|nr:LADA_0C08240g1_1 [Lachancea dasiensis]